MNPQWSKIMPYPTPSACLYTHTHTHTGLVRVTLGNKSPPPSNTDPYLLVMSYTTTATVESRM